MDGRTLWDELEELKKQRTDWYSGEVRKYVNKAKEPPGVLSWKQILSLLEKHFGITTSRNTIRFKYYNDKERKNGKPVHGSERE